MDVGYVAELSLFCNYVSEKQGPAAAEPLQALRQLDLLINGSFQGEKKVTFYDRHCCMVSDVCCLLEDLESLFCRSPALGLACTLLSWGTEWGRPANDFGKQMKSCNERPLPSKPLKQIHFNP